MEHSQEVTRQPETAVNVGVIVVNFNGGPTLLQCLAALRQQTYQAFRVIVVDNASQDGSIDRARKLFPEHDYRVMPENLGFAAANNLAIKICHTEFVALLNPDALPEPNWLGALVAAAGLAPDAASFGSQQVRHDEPDLLDGTGDVYHCSGLVWRRGYGRPSRGGAGAAENIFSPCAAAALYRRQAVLDVGGFDEDFFCYLEDVDLGFRLRLANWQARYVSEAIVHHVGSLLSGGQRGEFAVYHGHRNLVWTFIKDMPGWLFWSILPFHLAMNIGVIALYSLRGQGGNILRAKRDAIRAIRPMLRKRREVQTTKKCSTWAIATMLNWAPLPRLIESRHRLRTRRP